MDELIEQMDEQLQALGIDEQQQQQILKKSVTWPEKRKFAESWFEDNSHVDNLLKLRFGHKKNWVIQMSDATDLILTEVLPQKRAIWLERVLLMSVWAQSAVKKVSPTWQELFVNAKALHSDVALENIPLMRGVAELTVQVAVYREVEN